MSEINLQANCQECKHRNESLPHGCEHGDECSLGEDCSCHLSAPCHSCERNMFEQYDPETKVTVEWEVNVNCTCPHCGYMFDLLSEQGDFWEHIRTINACEKLEGLDADWTCPECDKDFIIDKITG